MVLVPALAVGVQAAPQSAHGSAITPKVTACSSTIWKGITAKNWTNYVGTVKYTGSVVLVGLFDSISTNTYCGQMYSYATINTIVGSAQECVVAKLYYEVGGKSYTASGGQMCGGNGINNTSTSATETTGTAQGIGDYSGAFAAPYNTLIETP
jgi:hypothetical protein